MPGQDRERPLLHPPCLGSISQKPSKVAVFRGKVVGPQVELLNRIGIRERHIYVEISIVMADADIAALVSSPSGRRSAGVLRAGSGASSRVAQRGAQIEVLGQRTSLRIPPD